MLKVSYNCSQNMTNTMYKCMVSLPTKADKNFRVYLRINEKSITISILNWSTSCQSETTLSTMCVKQNMF